MLQYSRISTETHTQPHYIQYSVTDSQYGDTIYDHVKRVTLNTPKVNKIDDCENFVQVKK